MAGEIRNKFVSWTLNVVKEIKEITPKNNLYGVGVNLAVVPPAADASAANNRTSRVGVESVHPHGSAAAKAGLKSGDIIVQVDGKKFYNNDDDDDGDDKDKDKDEDGKDRIEKVYLPDDVASAIRGPEGSEVNVIVERSGERIEFMLTRKPIGQRRIVQQVAANVATANDQSKDKSTPSSSSLMKKKKTTKTKSGQVKQESGSKQSEKQGGKNKKQESSGNETQGETQEQANNTSSSSRNEESKTNENETATVVAVVVVTPEKSRGQEPKKNEKERTKTTAFEKNEKETLAAAAAVVITPESKKGTTVPAVINNLLDTLESLPLSEEEEKYNENTKDNDQDLVVSSSFSTESDQFDHATSQKCRNATSAILDSMPLTLPCLVAPSSSSVTVVNASNASRSRDLIADNGISEEKTADLDYENDNNNEIPSIVGNDDDDDDDSQWEMISERSGSTIMISFSGSVSGGANTSFHTLKNKFVLKELTMTTGKDDDTNGIMIDHVVLPTDTLQGLCLAYKISATRLRMENGFSGNSLRMAPKKLKIPVMPTTTAASAASATANAVNNNAEGSSNKMMIRMQDNTSAEFKLYAFVAELPHMELIEAKAYLDLSNWDLDEALRSAREDEGFYGGGGFFVEDPDVGAATDMLLTAVVRPKALTVRDIYEAMPPYEGNGFELKDIRRSEGSLER